MVMMNSNEGMDDKTLSYNKFEEMLQHGKIKEIVIENKRIAIFT